MRPWSWRWMERGLARRLPATHLPSVLGDLLEDFDRRCHTHGRLRAEHWMVREYLSLARVYPRCVPPATPRRSPLEGTLTDFRLAFRSFVRAPRFAIAVSGTVALAIAINVVAFGSLRAVLFGDRPFRDADRIVLLNQTAWKLRPMGFTTEALDIVKGLPSIEVVAGIEAAAAVVRGNGAPEYLTVGYVTPGFFEVFNAAPVRGRSVVAEDFASASQAAVISHGVWTKQFQRADDVVGRPIRIGSEVRTIVGVMPAGFDTAFPETFSATVWVPAVGPGPKVTWSTFARIRPGRNIETVATELRTAVAPLQAAQPAIELREFTTRFDNVAVERLGSSDAATARPGLLTFQAIAALLFFIAAANLANMFLARTLARRRELGTRNALGAGRARIVAQLMIEGGVLASAGAVAGLLLAYWTLPLLFADAGVLPRVAAPRVSIPEVLLGVGAAGALALFFAGLPAVLLTRADPLWLIRREASARRTMARGGLVFVQVALGVVVLVAAGLLIRSFVRILNEPLGFDPDGLVIAALRVPSSDRTPPARFLEQTRALLEADLGSHSYSVGSMPFTSGTTNTVWTLGPEPWAWERSFDLVGRTVDSRHFDILGIPLVQGRVFEATDTPGSRRVAVVNQSFVRRHAGGRDVLGMPLRTETQDYVIVGVVGDVRALRMSSPAGPAVYRLIDQQPSKSFAIAVKSPDPHRVGQVMERLAARLGPDIVVSQVTAASDRIAATETRRRFYVTLLGALGVLAATLSAIGIIGVMATTTAARRRELAIRIAIGGTPARVTTKIALAGFTPVVFGIVAGVAGAWALAQWTAASGAIQALLYQITPRDPLTLILSASVLLIVGALSCWLPARRAASVNPMVVLKAE